MFRKLDKRLEEWASRPVRHPRVLRGARQVGKTYLVRELAKRKFHHYLELNFEQDNTLSSLFVSKKPERTFPRIFRTPRQKTRRGANAGIRSCRCRFTWSDSLTA